MQIFGDVLILADVLIKEVLIQFLSSSGTMMLRIYKLYWVYGHFRPKTLRN